MKEYDVIVIGAGSGGLVAATTAHRKGLKTALVEKHKIGGECTHFGCVPSKALINAAKAFHSLHKMTHLGVDVTIPRPNFSRIMDQVDEIVEGIYQHETPDIFQNIGIDVFVDESGAQFQDAQTITIGDDTLRGEHFVISTGSAPRMIEIEGIENVSILHNENFWKLRAQPQKIAFIGGGVISAEIGQSLVRLGSDVSIIDISSRILKVTDEEIGSYLVDVLKKEGVKIINNATPLKFTDSSTLVFSQNGNEEAISADHFFIAAGRSPNVDGMNLDIVGVDFSTRGISTNEFLQTSVSHIYACGDVTTPLKFTHTASHQANICIDNILTTNTKKNDLSVFPWAIFTEPQIGHVGLTEKEARSEYGIDHISVFKVDATIDRFITDRKTGGMLKVIFNSEDQVVGAEAVGAHAGEWIQLLTLVIKNKIPAQEMANTIFAYPSYSEIIKKAFSRYLRAK